ncbi:MAG TPA: adenylate/guanylate cyclase domain-containing protein [Anaerolineae bacterium]|nr:adenylate/guanylate cyclase domain-containing protein [Anaerolineae bacterium]
MTDHVPTGTVTFLFTDVEGSTRLALEHKGAWEKLRQRHHAILRSAVEAEDGYVFQIVGDAFCVAFHTPAAAVRAAAETQRRLHAEAWEPVPLRVRIGVHTGEAHPVDGQYVGYLAMSSVTRVMSAAHGGQVLLSQSTFDLTRDDFPEGVAARDLGLHRLKDLRHPQHLTQLVVADVPSEFPPIKTLDSKPHNLPVQLTSFIGREQEIRKVGEMLERSRLVTLTGVGGTGKTRLSLQAAAEVLEGYEDGAWLVELAPLADPALVPESISAAMKVGEQPGRPVMEVLKEYLQGKRLLLILDNCEHLLEAAAEAADALLHAAPGLTILATAREALAISGEMSFPVRSLALPTSEETSAAEAARSEAVRLFAERAAAVQPGFSLNEKNSASVLRICQRLDGIPLALELAAARVKGLSPEQIASRLADRFRLLTGGSRTALPRQRTLEAAIDWSYKLLSEEERLLMRRLAVFAGGWNLEAAEAVCSGGEPELHQFLDIHLRLIDKSLVIANTEADPPRHGMLETIRQFAQERLDESGEAEGMRRRHAEHFAALVHEMRMELRGGPTQMERFAQLRQDYHNESAALEWLLGGGDAELGVQIVGDAFYYWWRDGHWQEWRRWAQLAAGQLDAVSAAARAAGLVALTGMEHIVKRDDDAAGRHGEAAVAAQRALGDRREVGWALFWLNMSIPWSDTEAVRQSQSRNDEVVSLLREAGDVAGVSQGLTFRGVSHEFLGDWDQARAAYKEALEIARQIGDTIRVQIEMQNLGVLALETDQLDEAGRYFAEGLVWAHENENRPFVLHCLAYSAWLLGKRGEPERAARLAGAVRAYGDTTGMRLQPDHERHDATYVAALRERLGDQRFEALRAEGVAMSVDQAIQYALGAAEL